MDQSYYADVRNEMKFVVILIGKNSKKKILLVCNLVYFLFSFFFVTM